MSRALFITRDQTLLDELLRLAAAAGVTPEVARDTAAALRGWSTPQLVLLGADLANEMRLLSPSRRPGVYVMTWGPAPDELFRVALGVGAERIVDLPRSEEGVTELLTDLGESTRQDGLVIGVLGGSGGAGATVFSCALAQVAAASGPAVVVDADPLGPGVDRMLGLDRVPGERWEGLCQTTGRLGARALREALPRRAGLGAVTWSPGSQQTLQAFAAREVLSAARRGHGTVVLDLPRWPDPLVEELIARCDVVLVVVAATVAGVASAARRVALFADRTPVRLVVRGDALDPERLARAVGAPVLATMADQRALAESVDLGLGPVRSRRGALGRAAQQVLRQLSVRTIAA